MTFCGIVTLRFRALSQLGLLLVALGVHPTTARSQAILGTLVEAETGAGIEGAAVILLDESGDQLSWRLTDTAGRFNFQIDRGGRFRLRADRIGHASVVTDLITLDGVSNSVQRIEAPVEAILLSGIEVEGARRCEVRPEDGVGTARVWEEARKALEAASQTLRGGAYRYVIRRYERELDATGRRVQSEESRILRRVTRRPFVSLDVDDLLSQGFVRSNDDGSVYYYAPDADVLLSDPFLDTHCMRLTEGRDESEGMLGLAFEPLEDRGVAEISGVLWLNPNDGRLQWLDYTYEYLDVPDADRLGGRVQFEGLPNGAWIVLNWSIRMPILTATILDGGRQRTTLVAIREEGGQVVRINDQRGERVLDSRTGTIEGVVLDSLGIKPVEGAVVTLDGPVQVETDTDGRFRFSFLAQGRYGVRVSNTALDTLGLTPETVYADVIPGKISSVRLQSYGLLAFLLPLCDQPELPEDKGVLVGYVHDTAGNPAVGAGLSITWREVTRLAPRSFVPPRVVNTMYWRSNMTVEREDGLYWACGPLGTAVEVIASWNEVESEPILLRFPEVATVLRQDVITP